MVILSKGEETKKRILQAAIEIFKNQGINWTSFQLLADRVGISQPALYKYFANKDALLLDCCLEVVKRGQAFIDAGIDVNSPAIDRMRSYVLGNIRWAMEKPREADLVFAMYSNGSYSTDFKKLHLKIDLGGIKRIETHSIHIFHENKKMQIKKLKIEKCARIIHSLLVGEVLKALRWPNESSALIRTKYIMKSIEQILQSTEAS